MYLRYLLTVLLIASSYWLDYGEGKDLDLEDRPRSRLDSEFVRYLSREERQKYLVKIDKNGK